jgi:uncharacterized protein
MSNPRKDPPTLAYLRAMRDNILALAHAHGAYDVRVFGSVARGEATPDSDVDLLICWDYQRISAWGGVAFDTELETLLGYHVDVVSEKGLSPLIKGQVLNEATPL